MPAPSNPAYTALLRAVLVTPDDGLPRLVLADRLEANGREKEGVSLAGT